MPVTVSITRIVKPGCEADFEGAWHDFVQRSLALPGQDLVQIMSPAPGSGSREYGVVRKFASREALARFRISAENLAWSQPAAELTEAEVGAEELTGLESWFTLPGAALRPLPKWKMAIATYLGVLPVVMVLSLTLGRLVGSWGFILSNAVFNACVVASLTWLVMPLITRALHRWLRSEQEGTSPNENQVTRRVFLKTGSTLACGITLGGCAMTTTKKLQADLILYNGHITTLDPNHPEAKNVAIKDGRIVGVDDADSSVSSIGGNLLVFPPTVPTLPVTGGACVPWFRRVFLAGNLQSYFTNKSVTGTMRMFWRLILSGKAAIALSSSITASGLGEE